MRRYCVLDGIRGAAVISMALYHFMWDMVYLAGADVGWFGAVPGRLWQRSICFTFIALSGFCWRLGHRRLRRGLTVFALGMAVSAVTLTFTPENRIIFGILTLLGSCMLLTPLLDKVMARCPPGLGLAASLVLFAVTENLWKGELFFGMIHVPHGSNLFMAFIGLPPEGFFSADYFPLIPWAFLFIAGYFLYGIIEKNGWLPRLEKKGVAWLEWTGRHALWIYLIHQPVIAGIFYLVSNIA